MKLLSFPQAIIRFCLFRILSFFIFFIIETPGNAAENTDPVISGKVKTTELLYSSKANTSNTTIPYFTIIIILILISSFIGLVTLKLKRLNNSLLNEIKKRNAVERELAIMNRNLKNANKSLTDSEARIRSYFNLPIIGIAITSEKKEWLEVNDALCEMLGYSREELKKKTWAELTHPNDLELDLKQFKRLQKLEADTCSLEKRYIHKNGRIIWSKLIAGCVRKTDNSIDYIVTIIENISEQKKAEALLQNTQKNISDQLEFMEILMNTIPNPVFFKDTALKYLGCNKAFEEMFGLDRKNIIGKRTYDIAPKKLADQYNKMDEELLSGTNRQTYESTVYDNITGVTRIVLFHKAPFTNSKGEVNGIVGVLTDITVRINLERILRNSEERYKLMANSLQCGIWQINKENKITYANPKMLELLGKENDYEIINHSKDEFIIEATVKMLPSNICKENDQTILTYKAELKGIDDSSKNVLISSLVIWVKDKSEIDYIIENVTDITPLRNAQEKNEAIMKQLMASEKLASIGVLSAGVAHEINNPNSFIMLNIGTLTKAWNEIKLLLDEKSETFSLISIPYEEAKPRIEKILKSIYDGSSRIKDIVLALKDYASQDVGQKMVLSDLNKVIEEAILIMNSRIKKATSNFIVEYAVPPTITMCNPQRIVQVIMNLINNACDAINDSTKMIKLSLYQDTSEGVIIVKVQDEGCGIESENMNKLTNPFFTTKRTSGGTGLGLSISEGIIKEHDGQLEFDSKLGNGTTVTITLPIKITV